MVELQDSEHRSQGRFRLGDWVVEPALNRVSSGGTTHTLEPKAMQVLVYLADRQGQVISRQELSERIWGDVVLVEGVLTRIIHILREVFEDDHRDPRYIETIRKSGYRLIQTVVRDGDAIDSSHTPTDGGAARPRHRFPRRFMIMGAAVALLAATGLVLLDDSHDQPPAEGNGPDCFPLTAYFGRERHPCISPDGNLIAFCWDCGDGGGFDIYVRQIDTDNPLRLTRHPEDEIFPVWSSGGDTLAFLRRGEEGGLYTVPALGGAATRLHAFHVDPTGLDWSRDGRFLVFAAQPAADAARALIGFELATGAVSPHTSPPPECRGDLYPAFSPDGEEIAFVRSDAAGFHDLYILSWVGGEVRRITHGQRRVVSVDWLPGGDELVFCAKPTGAYQLWTVGLDGGDPVWLPTRHETAMRPAVSPRGDCLVYEALLVGTDIMQLQLDPDLVPVGPPTPCVNSTAADYGARFSRDGARIAFVSMRSGFPEIWVREVEGGTATQITHLESADLSPPCWSPDSRHLAFSIDSGEGYAVTVCDLESGVLRWLHPADAHEIVDFWSPDGRWLYCHTPAGSWNEYHRVSPDGLRAEALELPQAALLKQCPLGDLYYVTYTDGSLWRRSPEAAGDTLLVRSFLHDPWQDMVALGDGMLFTDRTDRGRVLDYLDLASGDYREICRFDEMVMGGITASPTGDRVLFESQSIGCDLMLMTDLP